MEGLIHAHLDSVNTCRRWRTIESNLDKQQTTDQDEAGQQTYRVRLEGASVRYSTPFVQLTMKICTHADMSFDVLIPKIKRWWRSAQILSAGLDSEYDLVSRRAPTTAS